MKRRKPSLSMVIASLALFFALGGSAIAAQHYLITSTSQIKPSVIDKLKGKDGAPGKQGPAGPGGPVGLVGPQGPAGPRGIQGPPGEHGSGGSGSIGLSSLTLEEGGENRVPAYNEAGPGGETGVEGSIATCPSGERVVSGGSDVFAGIVAGVLSVPSEDHQSWIVVVANDSTYTKGVVQAIAYCAASGDAVAASDLAQAHARAVREAGRLRAKLAARVKASKG